MCSPTTLGNSPGALRNNLHELHSEDWLRRQLRCLTDCASHRRGHLSLHLEVPNYPQPAPFPPFPTPKWLLAVYVRDVWSRPPALLAQLTSVYGSMLKVDSTKKVVKKLQGAAANTARWATNISNERGEIVHSVFTCSESSPSLQRKADSLVERYDGRGNSNG